MLNAEFVNAIATQAVKAAGPPLLTVENEASDVYFLKDKNGEYQRQVIELPRSNEAGSLQPFPMFAKSYPKAEIWYSRTCVRMILDADHRDQVMLPLEFSPQLKELQALGRSAKFQQPDFVLLLRTKLANCFDPDLLAIVRQVRFTQQVSGGGEIRQGKTSIGRDVQEEVTGAAAIPEVVEFNVPIWSNGSLAYRRPVACALVVDTSNQTFCLIPLPNAIEEAIAAAERQLGQNLEELVNGNPESPGEGEPEPHRTPIYYGAF